MNITINTGAATDDAAQIDTIVSEMQEDMEILNGTINSTIPDGIQTEWSEIIKTNWQQYYTDDVPAAMEDIKLSAANLRLAIEQVLSYDREQQ